jgi:hypothetical protein
MDERAILGRPSTRETIVLPPSLATSTYLRRIEVAEDSGWSPVAYAIGI